MWFFLNLYLQQVLSYGAFEGGAALLPMTAAIMLGMVVVAPKVIARLGVKVPTVIGLLLLATGMAILALVPPDGSFVVDVLPASLIAAAGMSLAFIPTLGGDPVRQAGRGRPRVGDRQHQLPGRLRARPCGDDRAGQRLRRRPARRPDGAHRRLRAAFLGAAGIAVIGAVAAAALLRTPRAAPAEAAGVEPNASVSV